MYPVGAIASRSSAASSAARPPRLLGALRLVQSAPQCIVRRARRLRRARRCRRRAPAEAGAGVAAFADGACPSGPTMRVAG